MSYTPTQSDIDEHLRDKREESARADRDDREEAEIETADDESQFFYIH